MFMGRAELCSLVSGHLCDFHTILEVIVTLDSAQADEHHHWDTDVVEDNSHVEEPLLAGITSVRDP